MFLFKDDAPFFCSAVEQMLLRFMRVNPYVSLQFAAGSVYLCGCILSKIMFDQQCQALGF